MTQPEIIQYLSEVNPKYKSIKDKLITQYRELIEVKERFPIRLIKTDNFDDLTLRAANAKYRSILLNRRAQALSSQITNEYNYLKSEMLLYVAPEFFKELKLNPTEALRKVFLENSKPLMELHQLSKDMADFSSTMSDLKRMFESDEVNFRKLAETKRSMGGF